MGYILAQVPYRKRKLSFARIFYLFIRLSYTVFFQASSTLTWVKIYLIMIHLAQNRMKCILLNEQSRDISLVQLLT